MELEHDGGPVHPVRIPIPGALHANGEPPPTELHLGLSKRELFAAILMHGELTTCGVPGEACEALVEASRDAGDDVIDHMAGNAVEGADALLRALSAPRSVQYRELYASEQEKLAMADQLATIVKALQKAPGWADLPEELRISARNVASDVLDPPIPF